MNIKIKYKIIFFITVLLISCNNQREIAINNSLPDSPFKINPLKIGDKIPKIILKDIEGNKFNLLESLKAKPTILIYYRGGWCLYCNNHLGQLQEIEQQLFDLGYQILAISADLSNKISETIKKHSISYTIASDNGLEGAKTLGLVFNAGKEYEKMFPTLENYSGNKKHILPVPAAFIVNQKGIIQFEYINPNSKIRIAPEVLLSAAKVAINEIKL